MAKVIVTGAAGGIGGAVVARLVAGGFEVYGLDLVACKSTERFESHVVDLTELGAVVEIVQALGPIDHVVAVAGGALPEEKQLADIAQLSPSLFQRSLEVNLTTAFNTVLATLPQLRRARGDRSITFTTSTDALVSYGLPAYAAAKAGIIGLVRGLTGILGREGIRVNAVAPGDIPTARNEREWAHVPEWYEQLGQATALRRLGTPEELAEVYLSLLSGMTSVTGQILVADGGFTAMGLR